jgi:hypothetical protein
MARASANSRGLPCATRAPPPSHPDFRDAERLQRPQRVAGHDPAHAEAAGDLLLGAEDVAGFQAPCEQRRAHVGNDHGRQRRLPSAEIAAGTRVVAAHVHGRRLKRY